MPIEPLVSHIPAGLCFFGYLGIPDLLAEMKWLYLMENGQSQDEEDS